LYTIVMSLYTSATLSGSYSTYVVESKNRTLLQSCMIVYKLYSPESTQKRSAWSQLQYPWHWGRTIRRASNGTRPTGWLHFVRPGLQLARSPYLLTPPIQQLAMKSRFACCWAAVVVVSVALATADTTMPASDPRVVWSGRVQTDDTTPSGAGPVSFDWLGVTARVTVTGASYVTANISTSAAHRGTRLKAYLSDQVHKPFSPPYCLPTSTHACEFGTGAESPLDCADWKWILAAVGTASMAN